MELQVCLLCKNSNESYQWNHNSAVYLQCVRHLEIEVIKYIPIPSTTWVSVCLANDSRIPQFSCFIAQNYFRLTSLSPDSRKKYKHWSSAWIEMVAILHETAFFIPKSILLSKQSSLLQIKYSKLHPNKPLNAVLCSANTRAKPRSYNCSCTFSSGGVKWEDSWLGILLVMHTSQ